MVLARGGSRPSNLQGQHHGRHPRALWQDHQERRHGLPAGLLELIGEDAPGMPDPRRFKTNESAAKIVTCSWWQLRPRRPDTGEEYARADITAALTDAGTAADAVRNIFPRRFVPEDRRLWAANRVLMPVLAEEVPAVSGLLQR